MGLIRKAIVLGGILYALPYAPDAQQGGGGATASLQSSTFAAVEAAAGTVADLKGFCERQPRACVAGQYLAYAAEAKAKYIVQAAYAWSAPQPAAEVANTGDDPPKQTASTKPAKNLKSGVPALRRATINDSKPASIEDLLKGTQE